MVPPIDLPPLTEKFAFMKAQVTNAELRRYAALVYARLGIRLSPKKKTLLSNRVMRRLRETSFATFGDYLQHLEQLEPDHAEWDAFAQEITTHETHMFREPRHWEWFEEEFLRRKKAEARVNGGFPSIRIWSAACSTGEEPYTIAACVAGSTAHLHQWQVHILGTDVAVGALRQAKRAEFSDNSMRLLPARLRRFFKRSKGEEVWRPLPALREMITFRRHNLLDAPTFGRFDLVMLKNVLIYFDADSKRRVVQTILDAVKPDGFLLSGSAEGIAEWAPECERMRPWLVRRHRTGRLDEEKNKCLALADGAAFQSDAQPGESIER